MNDFTWSIVLFGPPLAVLYYIYWKWNYEARRRAQLDALATSGSWTFSPVHDEAIGRLVDLEAFSKGADRYAFNTISANVKYGPYSCTVEMGDFSYSIDGDPDRRSNGMMRRRFSYLVVRLPFRTTPQVRLRREGVADAIAQAAGFEDIDFESDEFNRIWCVSSTDKRFAYDLIHPRALEYLLTVTPPSRIEIAAGRISVTDGVRRWTPDEFRRFMRWAQNFVALWPPHLAEELPLRSI